MACPPGTVKNPYTLRCVKVTGRRAKELLREGDIQYQNMAAGWGWQQPYRQTRRAPRRTPDVGLAAAFGVAAEPYRPLFRDEGVFRPEPAAAALPAAPAGPRQPQFKQLQETYDCPPGTQRNPATGRCLKITGRTFKRVFAQAEPPAPPPYRPASVYREAREAHAIPVGAAAVAPIAERSTVLAWAGSQCASSRDAITGQPFTNMDAMQLQELVRLHNRACTLATPLNTKVAIQHKAGEAATVPGDSSEQLTLDDFVALRTAMRRRDPAYKIPGRRRQPPPSSWKLYVSSDSRSGPKFASVLIVDVTKVHMGSEGPEYPLDSIKVDMGYIPIEETPGAMCTPKTIVKLLDELAKRNRLLTATAGGWTPPPGFPFTKAHWERNRAEKVTRLCKDLAKLLGVPT